MNNIGDHYDLVAVISACVYKTLVRNVFKETKLSFSFARLLYFRTHFKALLLVGSEPTIFLLRGICSTTVLKPFLFLKMDLAGRTHSKKQLSLQASKLNS